MILGQVPECANQDAGTMARQSHPNTCDNPHPGILQDIPSGFETVDEITDKNESK